MRASKYRHVFGQAAKRELQYENLKITGNAWDSNLIKTNGEFIAVNWNSNGGGAFAVIPVKEVGKAPDQPTLFRGHTAQVLDTDFDNFNNTRVASASDDSRIGIWEIPDKYSFQGIQVDAGESSSTDEPSDVSPVKFLQGHSRKVGHVLFHPTARDVLASSSGDYTVKIWNIETGKDVITLKHPDMVTSMSFSWDGDRLATVARDKKLRIWDIRSEKVISEGPAHSGAKNQRVAWLGNTNRIVTTGFSRLSDRQVGIWDVLDIGKGCLGGFYTIDQSSGVLMPFYDEGNKILYLAGKGDGNIRYYEFQDDELYELSEYQSTDPQRGFAVAPKRTVNVRENEVLKCFKTVVGHCIEPLSFYVPRKSEEFQEDIYPDAPSSEPALTAEEWFEGKSVDGPLLMDMRSVYEGSEPTLQPSHKAEATVKSDNKQTPIKESVKSDTVKEQNEDAKLAQPNETNFKLADQTSKGKLEDKFKTADSVNAMLEKSSTIDDVSNIVNSVQSDSNWDDEDDKVKIEEPMEVQSEKVVRPTVIEQPVLKEAVSIATDQVSAEIEPGAEGGNQEPAVTPKAVSNTPGAKSLGLKQSVEKLSSLVLNLESVVEKLSTTNCEKDERLAILESKIDELLKK